LEHYEDKAGYKAYITCFIRNVPQFRKIDNARDEMHSRAF